MEGKVFSDWLQKRVEYKQEGEEEEERSEEENDWIVEQIYNNNSN